MKGEKKTPYGFAVSPLIGGMGHHGNHLFMDISGSDIIQHVESGLFSVSCMNLRVILCQLQFSKRMFLLAQLY